MIFAQKVWRLLVGIKDGLALLFLLLFFLILYGALTARPGAGTVREGALLLRLDGTVVEEPAAVDPFRSLVSQDMPTAEYRARDIVRALRTAAKDERIKAVVLDLSRFGGGGLVTVQDIGAALDEVRAANKPVLAYAMAYTDDGVMLAAHASEVWVDPMGGAFIMGPGGNNIYFARLFEKLKVNAQVFRVGTFKSAVEPYLRNDQSPEARANAEAFYGAMWADWQADVIKARPKANIALATKDPAAWLRASGGDAAKAALAAGLADRIGNSVQFGERVAALAGPDKLSKRPGRFAHTSLRAWLAAHPPKSKGKAIGVVTIAGEIVDGEQGPGMAGGDRIAGLLDDALDKDLAALVVRVDSPGGSILASERIREAILRHKTKGRPIVVSMANLAASGGYWVSTPANRIFAEPGTVTGSIGVFAFVPTFERTLAELGVTSDGVKTTPLSGQPDLAAGLSPAVAAMLQTNIEHAYGQFVGLVAKARGKTPQQVDAIAQGRVWDGGTARQIGLVDRFGGLDDALAEAAVLARLDKGAWHAEYLGDDADPYASLLGRLTPDEDSAPASQTRDLAGLIALREQALVRQALGQAQRLLGSHGAQVRCLECPVPMAAVQSSPGDAGLLARIALAIGLI